MNYAELTDDELRLEVAWRCGWTWANELPYMELLRSETGLLGASRSTGKTEVQFERTLPDWTHKLPAAIALLESTGAEYNFGKRITGTPKPVYDVIIWGYYSAFGDDYEATADTLPRAACVAWLMWDDARKEAQHDNS